MHWSVAILGRFDGFLTDEDGDEDEPEDATDQGITANGHGARSDRSTKDAWELESTSEEDVEVKDAQRPLRSHNQQALPYRADESAGTEQRPEVGHTARRRHTDVAPSAPQNLRGLNPEEKALLVRRFDSIRPGLITDTQGTQGPKVPCEAAPSCMPAHRRGGCAGLHAMRHVVACRVPHVTSHATQLHAPHWGGGALPRARVPRPA